MPEDGETARCRTPGVLKHFCWMRMVTQEGSMSRKQGLSTKPIRALALPIPIYLPISKSTPEMWGENQAKILPFSPQIRWTVQTKKSIDELRFLRVG